MQCPYCNKQCKSNEAFCPTCLRSFTSSDGNEASIIKYRTEEWKHPNMLTMLKNDWKILVVIVILVLGIPALLSYNTSKKDQTVIGQVKLFLAEGYSDNENLAEVNWGRVNDAKYLLLKLSENSSVRKEADILAAEIAARETGMAIVEAEQLIDNDTTTFDIEKTKKIKENFTYVQPSNRYYQQAKEVLPGLANILDIALLVRAKQEIVTGKISEARNDLAYISTQSPYAYQAKITNDKLCEVERAMQKAEKISKRQQYAKNLEQDLVSKSKITISVIVSGENSEYLTIKYKLLSRSLFKKYADEDKIISNAQELGFKRITFDAADGDG